MGKAVAMTRLGESTGFRSNVYTYTVLASAYSNGGEMQDYGVLQALMRSGLRVKGMTRGLIIVVKEMEKEFVEAESIAAMV
ncbi:hypothetical protein JHK82_015816 [Glycine max]|nr:hypothetical protein JHK85_016222 [Glycine max]KAG5148935.1 hypothetical protein JHK82_015816 [Glycine max]